MNITTTKTNKKIEIIDMDRYINFIWYTGKFDSYGIPISYRKTYFTIDYAWSNRKRFLKFLKKLFIYEISKGENNETMLSI